MHLVLPPSTASGVVQALRGSSVSHAQLWASLLQGDHSPPAGYLSLDVMAKFPDPEAVKLSLLEEATPGNWGPASMMAAMNEYLQ